MKRFFVDTSFWIALELSDDQNHRTALKFWSSIDLETVRLITTSYVLDESVTFLNSRQAHRNAVQLGESILLSHYIELIHVDLDTFFEGWEMFKTYDDKKFSLTDCISFVVMKHQGLQDALSFDSDFEQSGFRIQP